MRMGLPAVAFAAFAAAACFGGSDVTEIHLAADGTITLNGQRIPLSALAEADMLGGDDATVRVSADGDVAYRHVDALQRTLRTLDLDHITFEVTEAEAR
jgi:biopolymer transport protein ExbD